MSEVTIITPCYNGFKFMNKYWEALEKQTYKDFEIIIVNDCSTDDTFQQLINYKNNSKLKITIINNKENSGPGKSRNIAINQAQSKWIAFCDCDDWFEKDFLQIMLDHAKEFNSDLVMCNYCRAYSDGSKDILNGMNIFNNNSTKNDYLAYSTMTLCRMLIFRDLFEGVQMPDTFHGEDGAVTPQLLAKARKISIVKNALYNYNMRENSLSTMQVSANVYKEFIKAYNIVNNAIYSKYPLECEFIGIKAVCYGATLNAFKANVSLNNIKNIIDFFEIKHKYWFENPYISSLRKGKQIYLYLLYRRCYLLLLFYSYLHKFYIKNIIK